MGSADSAEFRSTETPRTSPTAGLLENEVYPAYNEQGDCPGDCPLERSTPPVPQVSHLYPSPTTPTSPPVTGPGKLNPDLLNRVAAGIKIQPQSSARSSSSITPPSNQHSPRNDEYLMMRSSQPSRYGGTQVLPPLGGLSLKPSTTAATDPLKQTPTLEPLREERSSPVTARESNTNRFYASHGRSSKYPS